MRRFLRSVPVLALLAGAVVLAPSANAAPGDLDPTYGEGGVAKTAGLFGRDYFLGYTADVDELGRVVQLGFAPESMGLVRFTPEGELDPTFAVGGLLMLPQGFVAFELSATNNGIVLGGMFDHPDSDVWTAGLVRVTDAGQLDPALDGDGVLQPDTSHNSFFAEAKLTPTGGIVVSAHGVTSTDPNVLTLHRLTASGESDATFGDDGVVAVTLPTPTFMATPQLAVDSLGRTVVVVNGRTDDEDLGPVYALRLEVDGSVDPTFANGLVADGWAAELELAPDGSMYLSVADDHVSSIVKLTPSGAIDRGFGMAGRVAPENGRALIAITPLASGHLAVVTEVNPCCPGGAGTELTVLRPDGTIEPAFGVDGVVAEPLIEGTMNALGSTSERLFLSVEVGSRSAEGCSCSAARAYSLEGLPVLAPVASVAPRRAGLEVTWTEPEEPGVHPIVGYQVEARRNGGVPAQRFVAADARSATLTGLGNDLAYDVVVTPLTRLGAWVPSAPVAGTPAATAPVTTAPGAVEGITTGTGPGWASISWGPPSSDGGAPIRGYSAFAVNAQDGALHQWRNVGPDVRSVSFSGLSSGVEYDLYVVAHSALGFGTAAPAAAVTSGAGASSAPPVLSWAAASVHADKVVASWGAPVERGQAVTAIHVITLEDGVMTGWVVASPDQRVAIAKTTKAAAATDVYVVPQSAGGFGPLGEPVHLDRVAAGSVPTVS